jgi:predicted dienelactone hydrolase
VNFLSKLKRSVFRLKFSIVLLGGLAAILLGLPLHAAEQIYLSYSPLGFSTSVAAIETFIEEGKIDGTLKLFLSRLSPQQQSQIRGALRLRYDVNPVTVAQFSYTSSGEKLLQEAGELVQTPAGQNGFYGIRSASILAAADPEGLSILNWLRQFPTDMKVDLGKVSQLRRRIMALIEQTQRAITALEQQTEAAAATESPIDFGQRPDLRQPGAFTVARQTLTFYDASRDRHLVTDLYLPEGETSPAPVIVISNGLGARRDRFIELANHLASYGFAVAAVDHPGSDRQRLRDFYAGLYRENFAAEEFVDRPIDITFLLDQLQQLNATPLVPRLNLEQVGVFGYSFGGTTALSLAGAEIHPELLQTNCETQMAITNISLLYQCRALELTQPTSDLSDDRIQAIYLFVPFGRSLFGQAGMGRVNTPVLWEATDQDFLTPLAIEQLPAFAWLTTPEKYLVVSSNLPHARVSLDLINGLTNQTSNWDKLRTVTQHYHNALSVAFFKTYLTEEAQYRPYLQSSYVQVLTEEPYRLSLVQTAPDWMEME